MRVCDKRIIVTLAGLMAILGPAAAQASISYDVDLREPASHLIRVVMTVPHARARTEIQFPAWNALYQIRDFVRDVEDLEAQCDSKPIALVPVDLYTWSIDSRACSSLSVRYSVYADEAGVFSSELIPDHAFLNLAEELFYIPGERDRQATIHFDVPAGWKVVTLIERSPGSDAYQAPSYDSLVDSPVEAGQFQIYSFTQGETRYRVAVRARAGDYSSAHLLKSIARITSAETALMRDMPCARYTFIFHFSPHGGGGGMEHACGAAISFPQQDLRTGWRGLEEMIAHEFFHLWNVKRVRPQGLDPVSYVRPTDTRDLWFSEGVTSYYADLVLVRAGLISRDDFYRRLARAIQQLQERPARHFQSVELSGIDAWLEKYSDYERPDRSISYYDKGELLGCLLDLGIRQASSGHHSLDSLMRRLDTNFAERHRDFTDQDLERMIGELAPPSNWVETFFREYVFGTTELAYNRYLSYAGLRLDRKPGTAPDWGFESERGFDGHIRVAEVKLGSSAANAGIKPGDVLTAIDGEELYALPQQVRGLKPEETVELTAARGGKPVEIVFKLGSRPVTHYAIAEIRNANPGQLKIRASWLGNGRASAE